MDLGIQPSEFWKMTVPEFMLLYNAKKVVPPEERLAGTLTKATCKELYALLKES